MSHPPASRAEGSEQRSVSVSDLVFETLRARIVEGALGAGDPLPGERRLAADLGVNRGAVREGLKRLEQAGLIAIQHGGPTRVLDFRRCPGLGLMADAIQLPDGTIDAKVARSYLEMHRRVAPHVSRLAAERTGAKLAQAMESHLRAIREADAQHDAVGQNLLRIEMWCALARGSENLVYMLLMSSIRYATRCLASHSAEMVRQIPSGSLTRLSELAFAVVAGDGDAAERCGEEVTEALQRSSRPTIDARLSTPGATQFASGRLGDPPQPEPRESVSNQVFVNLRERILAETIPPGAALPGERALAAQFGVNRGAVREALKRLEQLQLISIQHGGPTRVLDYRDSPALELLAQSLYAPGGTLRGPIMLALAEMSTRVSPDIARLAALRAGSALAEPLRDALAALEAATDAQAARNARQRFWDVLAFGSDNLVYRFLTHVIHQSERGLRPEHHEPTHAKGALREMLAPIVDAVVCADPERAERAAEECAKRVELRMHRNLMALSEAGELD